MLQVLPPVVLMPLDGWVPQGRGPVQVPCRWSSSPPLTHGLNRARALTWRHRALMMIDRVVFFISLSPISACCNLSNDGSLLAIAGSLRASLFCPSTRPCGTALKDQWLQYTLLIWKSYFNCEVQINGYVYQICGFVIPPTCMRTKQMLKGIFF